MGEGEAVGLREAAEQLGVHYMTAYRYVRTGALPATQRDGRWYVDPSVLTRFSAERAATSGRAGRPPTRATDRTLESLSPRQTTALTECLVRGDQGGAWQLVYAAIQAGADLRQIDANLLVPALRCIGEQWARGVTSVGEEHRATVVAQRLIALLGRSFARRGRTRGTVVLSAAPGDRHALPTAILADLLRVDGLAVADLGADMPSRAIAEVAAGEDRLVAIGICVTTPLTGTTRSQLLEAVEAVGRVTDRPVLLGGAAIDDAMVRETAPGHWSTDADEAVAWFTGLTRGTSKPKRSTR